MTKHTAEMQRSLLSPTRIKPLLGAGVVAFGMLLQAVADVAIAATMNPTSFGNFSAVMAMATVIAVLAACGVPQVIAKRVRSDARQSSGLVWAAAGLTIPIGVGLAYLSTWWRLAEYSAPLILLTVGGILWLIRRYLAVGAGGVLNFVLGRDVAAPLAILALVASVSMSAYQLASLIGLLWILLEGAALLYLQGPPSVTLRSVKRIGGRLLAAGAPFAWASIAAIFMTRADVLIVEGAAGSHATGIYAFAMKFAIPLMALNRLAEPALYSKMKQDLRSGGHHRMFKRALEATALLLVMAILYCGAVLVLGDRLGARVDAAYSSITFVALPVCLAYATAAIAFPAEVYCTLMDRERHRAWAMIAGCLLLVIVGYYATRTYGLSGMGWSVLLAFGVSRLYLLLIAIKLRYS